jgi:hypothetical protein
LGREKGSVRAHEVSYTSEENRKQIVGKNGEHPDYGDIVEETAAWSWWAF